jgi:hypothetical protein
MIDTIAWGLFFLGIAVVFVIPKRVMNTKLKQDLFLLVLGIAFFSAYFYFSGITIELK